MSMPSEDAQARVLAKDMTFHGGISFTTPKPPSSLTIGDAVTINMETLDVVIHDGVTVPEAAKAFWNGVAMVMGKPPLFPECPHPPRP